MKRIIRILVLAVALVTGLTTVSAQTVQVLLVKKVAVLPSTVTNYLDDPFRYFNVQFILSGAGPEGLDIFFDMEFTVNTSSFYVRTRQGTIPMNPIHLNEGINMMRTDVLHTQVVGRTETNFDYASPLTILQLPEGTYELCLDVYRWSDKDNPNRTPINVGPCPNFDICYSGSAPELVSPLAGAQIALNGTMVVNPTRKINFFWTPVISNCSGAAPRFRYEFKVVKVLNGQNYQDAIRINPTAFSAVIRNNTYAVFDTLRDVKIQMEKGALYVAQVQAEQIKTSNSTEDFIIANDGKSQPMPFYWGYVDNINNLPAVNNLPDGNMGGSNITSLGKSKRTYGYVIEDESEEGEVSEGIAGVTVWDGGVEEASDLETIFEEMQEPQIVGFSQKRHYVESDGYYTIPATEDLEVVISPVRHESLKQVSYEIEVYDYMDGGIDSITAYEPLCSKVIEDVPERLSKKENHELITRTLEGCGAELEEGNLYYLQVTSSFTIDYWEYMIADTCFYVNDMLAEHIHDTISREFTQDEFEYPNGVFFQWGDDPETPTCMPPQWMAPVDRSGDDIYDPANYAMPTSIPGVQKAKTFPVSWSPVKNVSSEDQVEYEVNVYELKSGQTAEEAISENKVLVTRTLIDTHEISETDKAFFKVFSPNKTYVMTLSANVEDYHFENGNEALPIIFSIKK